MTLARRCSVSHEAHKAREEEKEEEESGGDDDLNAKAPDAATTTAATVRGAEWIRRIIVPKRATDFTSSA